MANTTNEILIQKYLNGTASQEELAKVEHLLEHDKDFTQMLKNEQLVKEFAHMGGLVELKAKMKAMNLKPAKPSYTKWGIAAGLFFALVAAYLLNTKNNTSPSKLPADKEEVVNKKTSIEKQNEVRDSFDTSSEPQQQKNYYQPEEDKEISVITTKAPVSSADTAIKIVDTISLGNDVNHSDVKQKNLINPLKVDTLSPDVTSENLCQISFINPEFEIKPSCEGSSTGEIFVKNVDGCFPPYRYEISNSGVAGRTENKIFSNLSKGSYNITIYDTPNDSTTCSKSFTVIVGSKECRDEEKIISSLNPDVPCVFNLKEGGGVLYIYNSNGNMISQTNFSNQSSIEWYGKDRNGSPLPTGEYFYQIKYNSGEQESGNLTIAN